MNGEDMTMRTHSFRPVFWIAAAVMALCLAITAGGGAGVLAIPTDPQGCCPVTPAKFAGWFETGVPAANGVVKPANSVTFPGVPNCDFYDWSKQMFLWLTSPAPSRYGGGSRIFNS